MPFRSGFVSIIGRPNAGKSTLLNALLGQKLAIVTHKPQTTRTRILGVLELPALKKSKQSEGHPAAQLVLVDTPGIHKPDTQLDRRMMQEVHDALESRNAVLFIVDVTHRLPKAEAASPAPGTPDPVTLAPATPAAAALIPGDAKTSKKITGRMALSAQEDDFSLQLIRKLDCPVLLLLNKIDQISPAGIMPLIAHWSALYPFAEIIPISARKKINLDLLLAKVIPHLPEGQRYFPPDQLTDQPERFLVAELIREKILLLTGEEVPYSTAVVIEKFEEPLRTGPEPNRQAPQAQSPALRDKAKPRGSR